MVTTMQQLMEAKSFQVEDRSQITTMRDVVGKELVHIEQYYVTAKYNFQYKSPALWVSGDVFGDLERKVENSNDVLFHLAKGSKDVRVELAEGMAFYISNPCLTIKE